MATWQGLYFELREEDINYGDLETGFNTELGISTLSTKGVKLFKLRRAETRTTPRPHRFAVIPSGNPSEPCSPQSWSLVCTCLPNKSRNGKRKL